MRNVNHPWHVIIVYDYETIAGGTAASGTDYVARLRTSVRMQKDAVTQWQYVPIIDDSVNGSGETVKVRIGNARPVDDANTTVQKLTITRTEATAAGDIS